MKEHIVLEKDSGLVFPHIYAINASAGSGKTHTLKLRYLQLLLSDKIKNTGFRNIAAITFTNKAANEMKKKILQSLKRIALSDKQELSQIKQLVSIDEAALMLRAKNHVDEIIRNYSDLNISTIDSFINSIIKASAMESGIQPDFKVADNPSVYVEYVLDGLLEEIPSSPGIKKVFEEFIESFLKVEQGRSWYAKNAILDKLSSIRNKQNSYGKEFFSPEEKIAFEEVNEKLEEFLEKCAKAGIELKKNAINGLDKFLNNNGIESAYLRKEGCEDLFKGKYKPVPGDIITAWNIFRESVGKQFYLKASAIFIPYINIHRRVNEKLGRIKQERSTVFVDEINLIVNNLLKEYKVPYIYFKLGETISHYLIDEFQDTNEIQWRNIRDLVINSLSEGGSLFYVGDKKQAIYRYRGGRADLFDDIQSDRELLAVTGKRGYLKNLDENWRSRELIVDFCNEVFSKENLAKLADGEASRLIEKTFSGIRQSIPETEKKGKTGGFVYIRLICSDKENDKLVKEDIDEITNKLLADKVQDVIGQRSGSDIAILVRTNDQVKKITQMLGERGILTVSDSTGDLREHPLIGEIISFLKFLNDPLDNFAFASFVSGDIFLKASGMSRDDVYRWLLSVNPGKKILYRAFQNSDRGKNLWMDFIDGFFKTVGFLPPYDLTARIFDRFNILREFKNSERFLMHLLELLKDREEEGNSSLEAFIRFWEESGEDMTDFIVPLSASSDAVSVMTIHKAKGLEFAVVILPYAGVVIQSNALNELIVEDGDSLRLLYQTKKEAEVSRTLMRYYNEEYAKNLLDEINIFYVACTRAKDELYIFVPPKAGNAPNMLLQISPFNAIQDEYMAGTPAGSQGKEAEVMEFNGRIFNSRMLEPWEKRIAGLKGYADFKKYLKLSVSPFIEKGESVHKALCFIERLNEEKADEAIKSALVNSLPATGAKFIKEMEGKIRALLEIPEVRKWFFLDEEARVFCEVEVVTNNGDLKRIDRLILGKDSAVVVDFKTGESGNESRDKNQVREYADIIKSIYPERTVRGYIAYIDSGLITEVMDE
ncbi:MAG TPA: UvrD-helicase domain-containing protein [bacterium]